MTKREKVNREKNNTGGRRKWVWILFGLIVIQVGLANSLVTRGREINELTADRSRLRASIVSLENDIARASSLDSVQRGAEILGLRPGTLEFLPPPPLAIVP